MRRWLLVLAAFAEVIVGPVPSYAARAPQKAAGSFAVQPTLRAIINGGTSFDSRVTFARAIAAYDVNSAGTLVSYSSGQPRVGYDPTTLVPLGIGTFEQRTGLVVQSATPTNPAWTLFNASRAGSQADPFGGTAAALITADGTSNFHAVALPSTTFVTSTQYAWTALLKAGTTSLAQLLADSLVTTNVYANFSLSGTGAGLACGSGITCGAGVTSASIQAYPGGNYLLSMVATTNGSATRNGGYVAFISNISDGLLPTNTSNKTMVVAYGQVEATSANHSGPTPPIVTAASTVTVAADVASITGSAFSGVVSQTANTAIATFRAPAVLGTQVVWSIDDNTTGNQIQLRIASSHLRFTVTTSSSIVADLDLGVIVAGISYKAATAWAANDFAASLGGGAVVMDTSGALPTVTQMWVGTDKSGLSLDDHVLKLDLYKSSRLGNSKLIQKAGSPTGLLDLRRIPANDDQPDRTGA